MRWPEAESGRRPGRGQRADPARHGPAGHVPLRSGLHRALCARQRAAQAGLPHPIRRRHHAGRGDPRAGGGRGQSDPAGRQGAQSRLRGLRQVVRGFHRRASAARRSSCASPTTTRSIRKMCARRSTPTRASSSSRSSTPRRRPAPINPVQEIGAIAHEFGVLTMVDTVSGLGGELLSPEEWGMDIAIAGPQKCLGGPPGSGPDDDQSGGLGGDGASSASRCGAASSRSSTGRRPGWKSAPSPTRRSVCEMYALESVLTQILEDGMERFVERHQQHRRRLPGRRQGARARALAGARGDRRALRHRDHGAGGHDRRGDPHDDARALRRHDLARVRRVAAASCSGSATWASRPGRRCWPRSLAAFELALRDCGYPVQLGAGVGAAMAGLDWPALDPDRAGRRGRAGIAASAGSIRPAGARCKAPPISREALNAAIAQGRSRLSAGRDRDRAADRWRPNRHQIRDLARATRCLRQAGEPLRVWSLYAPEYLARLFQIQGPFDQATYDTYATPQPGGTGRGVRIESIDAIWKVRDGLYAVEAVKRYPSIPMPKRLIFWIDGCGRPLPDRGDHRRDQFFACRN